MGYNLAPLKDNCALFAPTSYFRLRAIRRCHLNFSPADPRCHGNEFWDKIYHNSVSVKDNCSLFAPTLCFRARAIWRCHLIFFPGDPCCHGKKFWDKIDYNSVCVRNICKIFASIRGFSGMDHRMLPTEFFLERPSLPWQRNLGHNGLELGLRKRYIEDLCIRCGVFKIGLFR